jgi:hypothetical protein
MDNFSASKPSGKEFKLFLLLPENRGSYNTTT